MMSSQYAAEQDDSSDAQRRKRSKDVYESVVRIVDYQSGGLQPPLASRPSVIGVAKRAGYGFDEIHQAIMAARGNGDLFQTTDERGRKRLGIDDRWKLREKIESNLSRADDPRLDLIGIANKRVAVLRERAAEEADDE